MVAASVSDITLDFCYNIKPKYDIIEYKIYVIIFICVYVFDV